MEPEITRTYNLNGQLGQATVFIGDRMDEDWKNTLYNSLGFDWPLTKNQFISLSIQVISFYRQAVGPTDIDLDIDDVLVFFLEMGWDLDDGLDTDEKKLLFKLKFC